MEVGPANKLRQDAIAPGSIFVKAGTEAD